MHHGMETLVIRMLYTRARSYEVHGHCTLNFLATLITKGCLTALAFQMVVVTVFFGTPPMAARAGLCSHLSP